MAVASLELQKSVYTTLSTGSYSVYEIVPPNTPMPYIVIGEETVTQSNTKTNKREIHNLTIHTWSKGSSSAESKIINDFVIRTLLADIEVNGFYLDKSTLEMLTTFKEQDTNSTIFHGVIQIDFTLTYMEV